MVIRTDTWRYKVWAWSHLKPADYKFLKRDQVSLCSYFWRVMLAILWLPFVTLICLTGKIFWIPLGLLINGLASFKWKYFHPFVCIDGGSDDSPFKEGSLGTFMSFMILLAVINWKFSLLMIFSILGITLFCGVFIVLSNKISNLPKTSNSLVLEYLSAVKQKVCPKIKFVDQD